jgi:phage tail sheath protein FI
VQSTYQTPGVSIEWIDRSAQQLDVGRTDVAGFVGLAPRGPVLTPTKIESAQQFFSAFGDAQTDVVAGAYLGYAVTGFFENGGRTCWVVRVANQAGARAARRRFGLGRDESIELEATSPGAWGNEVTVEPRWNADRIVELIARAPGRPLQVVPVQADTSDLIHRTTLLGVPTSEVPEIETVSIVQVPDTRDPGAPIVDLSASAAPMPLIGGADGLGELKVSHLIAGIEKLERVDGLSFVAVPDLMAPCVTKPGTLRFDDGEIQDAQRAIINSCLACGDRLAILDAPRVNEEAALTHRQTLPAGDGLPATMAALYHPWVAVTDPLRLTGLVRFIPPSGHVAGMFARVDRLRGVHKPPANEVLEGVYDLSLSIDDEAHGRLNSAGVNAIRIVPGRGTLVLGARTLSDDVRWRYVNVRRLFSMIEEALDGQMQWVVFEPNNPQLWRHIDRAIRGFLERLYRAGMLDGETSDDAYYVRCDETTNPPERTDTGQVLCVIGIQPPYPAEFVIVRIGVTRSGIQIEEKGAQDV